MDTISRDNNTSYLPVAGIIVGIIGLIVACVALGQAHAANKAIVTQGTELGAKIDEVGGQVHGAVAAADKANSRVDGLTGDTQKGFSQIAAIIGDIRNDLTKVQESSKAKAPAAGGKSGPVTAGPGEYIVKSGDNSGTKIAKENNVSIEDLKAVNPSVDWNKLKVGQKLKLPVKK